MFALGAWIVALFLAVAGPRLPGGSVFWIAIGFIIFAGAALYAPDASWPYLGAALLVISVLNLIRLKFLCGDFIPNRGSFDVKGSNKGKHVGKVATVTKAIRGGYGMVTVKNDPWRVRSDVEIPTGTKVRINGVDGELLTVAPVH